MIAVEIINPMSDKDAQILELFHQLTPDQQQTAVDFARLLNELAPETSPSARDE